VQFRQGDVFIEKINKDEIPNDVSPVKRDNGRVILAYGEVTGHAHAIVQDEVELFEREGTLFLNVKNQNGATVVHEEHGTIPLETGTYKVTHQREYHRQEIRNVAD